MQITFIIVKNHCSETLAKTRDTSYYLLIKYLRSTRNWRKQKAEKKALNQDSADEKRRR